MERLRATGHHAVELGDVAAWIRQGLDLPSAAVVLTFDDGYRSTYEQAFPVLQAYGMKATVFLTVGPQGADGARLPSFEGRPMLSWAEIHEMQRAGISFGAHTLTHPDLTRISLQQVETEMRASKARIEDRLGTAVECFAYPYGRYDLRSRELARQWFACACSDALGLVSARSDPWALERVDTHYLRTDRRFDVVFTRWFPLYVRLQNVPRRLRRRVASAFGSR
jgi:peptidoglycan/xylan/chitin deacetylase (PgdA/CDA1 family)